MTENLYGVLKRRFPFLKNMRCYLTPATENIYCCCALHNLAEKWGDAIPPPPEELPGQGLPQADAAEVVEAEEDDQDYRYNIIEDRAPLNVIRIRGQLKRDYLMHNMRPLARACR